MSTDEALLALERLYAGRPKDMFYARIRAALERQREGWKLVPLYPSSDMVTAFKEAQRKFGPGFSIAYGAMLAAAPDPEDTQ